MREIKFRGKRIDNGEWIYGDLWRREQNFNGTLKTFICTQNGRVDEVIPETVGQFTGLYDNTIWSNLTLEEKHTYLENNEINSWRGKRIFEGDILNSLYAFEGCKGVYQIIYRDDARFFPVRKGVHQQERVSVSMNEMEQCEIIGNIHDNPELINN